MNSIVFIEYNTSPWLLKVSMTFAIMAAFLDLDSVYLFQID